MYVYISLIYIHLYIHIHMYIYIDNSRQSVCSQHRLLLPWGGYGQ